MSDARPTSDPARAQTIRRGQAGPPGRSAGRRPLVAIRRRALAVSVWIVRETWVEPTMLQGRRCCNGTPQPVATEAVGPRVLTRTAGADGGDPRQWRTVVPTSSRPSPIASRPPSTAAARNQPCESRGHAGPTHVAGGRGRGGAGTHGTGSVRSTPDSLAARTRPRCAEVSDCPSAPFPDGRQRHASTPTRTTARFQPVTLPPVAVDDS